MFNSQLETQVWLRDLGLGTSNIGAIRMVTAVMDMEVMVTVDMAVVSGDTLTDMVDTDTVDTDMEDTDMEDMEIGTEVDMAILGE